METKLQTIVEVEQKIPTFPILSGMQKLLGDRRFRYGIGIAGLWEIYTLGSALMDGLSFAQWISGKWQTISWFLNSPWSGLVIYGTVSILVWSGIKRVIANESAALTKKNTKISEQNELFNGQSKLISAEVSANIVNVIEKITSAFENLAKYMILNERLEKRNSVRYQVGKIEKEIEKYGNIMLFSKDGDTEKVNAAKAELDFSINAWFQFINTEYSHMGSDAPFEVSRFMKLDRNGYDVTKYNEALKLYDDWFETGGHKIAEERNLARESIKQTPFKS